jgi:hypothetical protein
LILSFLLVSSYPICLSLFPSFRWIFCSYFRLLFIYFPFIF